MTVMTSGALSYAEAIRAYRQKRELTQEALAAELGVAVMTIRRYERGRNRPRSGGFLDRAFRRRFAEDKIVVTEASPRDG
jgi:transcriptional regulator with XRE-family HTH domain